MLLNQFLLLARCFCIGVYGVLARRNGVLVLMSVEPILAPSTSTSWPSAFRHNIAGEVFALFVIAIGRRGRRGPGDGPAPLPQPQEHRPLRGRSYEGLIS
jgi:hypothetical protein